MLTDAKVKAAKLDEGKGQKKLSDSHGLYLLVNKSGKYWRFDYRYAGKRKTLSIGTYPETKLKKARDARDSAKKMLGKYIDPNQAKQNAKQKQFEKTKADTFESVAMEWLAKHKAKWVESTYNGHQVRLAKHILPWLGSLPIQDIKPFDVLSVCLKIEKKGHAELARRVLNICSQVFRYGVASCRVESDPTRDLKGALAPTVTKNRARLTDPKEVGALMRAIQGFTGTHVVACALQLSPYVFLRPGELRKLEWRFIDFEAMQIVIPAENMKMKQKHVVPLAKQAVAILKDVQALTGQGKYVFHGARATKQAAP
ncbi:MAG: integrase arm-type DNA-binding domain-containing protein [Ghiorsea sp.]|nr:integrase arm-type DNA-binding domain-containing protein [Ghiorsea sp.]